MIINNEHFFTDNQYNLWTLFQQVFQYMNVLMRNHDWSCVEETGGDFTHVFIDDQNLLSTK